MAEAWRARKPAQRLAWPVVSVGSISAGGAGKTPVVIALAEMFAARGWSVDVLSRGYGRVGRGVERVVLSEGDDASRFGDEPVLIARRTAVPVWVGAQRFDAGVAAERDAGMGENGSRGARRPALNALGEARVEDGAPGSAAAHRSVHLLDDGFQHRQLARDFDVVLVTAEDLQDALLPAGICGSRSRPCAGPMLS